MGEIKSEIESALELGKQTAEDETQGKKWGFWNSSPFDYELTEGEFLYLKLFCRKEFMDLWNNGNY